VNNSTTRINQPTDLQGNRDNWCWVSGQEKVAIKFSDGATANDIIKTIEINITNNGVPFILTSQQRFFDSLV
jgi:hypothetical protein